MYAGRPRVARMNQRPEKSLAEKFPTGGIGGQVSEPIPPDASASSSIGSRVHSGDAMEADQRGLFSRDMLVIEHRTWLVGELADDTRCLTESCRRRPFYNPVSGGWQRWSVNILPDDRVSVCPIGRFLTKSVRNLGENIKCVLLEQETENLLCNATV